MSSDWFLQFKFRTAGLLLVLWCIFVSFLPYLESLFSRVKGWWSWSILQLFVLSQNKCTIIVKKRFRIKCWYHHYQYDYWKQLKCLSLFAYAFFPFKNSGSILITCVITVSLFNPYLVLILHITAYSIIIDTSYVDVILVFLKFVL